MGISDDQKGRWSEAPQLHIELLHYHTAEPTRRSLMRDRQQGQVAWKTFASDPHFFSSFSFFFHSIYDLDLAVTMKGRRRRGPDAERRCGGTPVKRKKKHKNEPTRSCPFCSRAVAVERGHQCRNFSKLEQNRQRVVFFYYYDDTTKGGSLDLRLRGLWVGVAPRMRPVPRTATAEAFGFRRQARRQPVVIFRRWDPGRYVCTLGGPLCLRLSDLRRFPRLPFSTPRRCHPRFLLSV